MESDNLFQFEDEILALEQKIRRLEAPENHIAFYGSSSIRLWTHLEDDLSPLKTINLGFGGSSFAWCIHYFDRVFKNLEPKHLVIYVGDNDLAQGVPPEKVLMKFRKLSNMSRERFPAIPIDFITIKPSPERKPILSHIHLTNQLIRKELLAMPKAELINVYDSMLDEKNEARPELFLEDQLHLNDAGYKVWKGVVRKHFGI